MLGIHQARPPFVNFKQIAKEDRPATLEKGYRVTVDIDMAYIMQPGSKDCVEIDAKDWLDSIKRKMLDNAADAYPPEWVEGFHKKYEMWKQGLEAPVDGTSVKEWPILSRSQCENFISVGIVTVEDIAAMTEEAMARIGMGSRALRDQAMDWLKGKEIASAAIVENAELKKKLEELQEQVNQLMQNKPEKRGRKAKEETTP